VHPIERLRYVARAGWVSSPSLLAAEAAWALGDLAQYEAPALVPACRRLLDRQPQCGPLWWVAARVVDASDPLAEAQRCARALEDDPTEQVVHEALATSGRVVRHGGMGEVASADAVLVEVDALGPAEIFLEASLQRMVASALVAEVPVWICTGVGRVLPRRIFQSLARRVGARAEGEPKDSRESHLVSRWGFVEHRMVDKVLGPTGACSIAEAIAACDCPEPPDLVDAL